MCVYNYTVTEYIIIILLISKCWEVVIILKVPIIDLLFKSTLN